MRILISNDDGIHAPGLAALARKLAESGKHRIFVVAPDRERSATGHSLTLHKPLRVESVELGGRVENAWLTTGTPSDCVKLAIAVLLEEKPDLVISGINSGPNLGTEILYSGTVAAAMEGAFLGVPSIAVSLAAMGGERDYQPAADFMQRFVELYPEAHQGHRTMININVPNLPADKLNGVRITELGVRLYDDHFEKRHDPRGKDYYWLTGHVVEDGETESSDAWTIREGIISITPVSFNMTDRPAIDRLNNLSRIQNLMGNRQGKNCTEQSPAI